MNRILICAVAALGLVACGGREPAQEPAATTAAEPAAVEAAGDPAAPPAEAAPQAPAADAPDEAADDGESLDAGNGSASPIAAAVAAASAAPVAAQDSRWKADQHYRLLPAAQPVSVGPGQVEVTEIFWYGCGHCFTLEPRVDAWDKKGRPEYVKLVRMPVVWNEVTREDARLFYTLEGLGKLDELHLAVFRELHERRNPLTVVSGNRVDQAATERRVRDFLGKHGVSADQFGQVYRSFATENKLRQAENLSRRYLADHTPMAVVHGKYQTDVGMAGGYDEFFQLLNDLAARERAAR